ncbi:hypothetical protein ACFQFA_00325 [Flavobacterium panici]
MELYLKLKSKIILRIMNNEIEIPIEHQKLVLSRIEASKVSPKRMLDWDEVSEEIIQT